MDVLRTRAPGFSKPGKSKTLDQSPVFHVFLTLIQVLEWKDQREKFWKKTRTILNMTEIWENPSVTQ